MVRTWCVLYILSLKCASRHNSVHNFVGKERYGSDDSVDGGETVGNSLGRAPWGRSETEATIGWTEEKPGRAPLGGSAVLRSRAVGTGFQDKFHQCDCPEKLCAQDFSSGLQMLGHGIASLAGGNTQNALLLARVFQDRFHQYDCSEKLCTQELPKFANPGPWDMHCFVGRERD